jgi:hypothetical protein
MGIDGKENIDGFSGNLQIIAFFSEHAICSHPMPPSLGIIRKFVKRFFYDRRK